MIKKELPIKIVFGEQPRPRKLQQHIKRIRLSGPSAKFPEEIRLDADEIAAGGVLTIEDLSLPVGFEVVDRRESEPIITVERPKKLVRGGRHEHSDEDDWHLNDVLETKR